ncbi:DNA-binding MarR family transcriptional regulator [Crossiella equi]|uniref:DNA-binding MarR family transcriptional regulator n=1 Tax=Crossiella equi TaxID=130796 RepID=A0ABS5AJ76_9PSEU|nr:MarR family transcriptional regulator [Crossiella equi]MBP2475750.1 DNA-binding MarR family transcriptional regulator [Crossiella equi]
MDPRPDAFFELLRQLKNLVQIRNAIAQRVWRDHGELHLTAVGMLADLVVRGPRRSSDLAQERQVDPSVVSRQVAQLMRAGLVERRIAPEDGRAMLLSASPAGIALVEQWKQEQIEWMRSALSGWRDEDLELVTGLIERLTDDLRGELCAQKKEALT